MTIQTFNVKLHATDTEETAIKFEDDISFGKLRNVLEASVDLSGVAQGKVTLKPNEYPIALTMASLVEPANLKENVTEFNKLSGKVALKIMKEICKAYSLTGFLQDIAGMLGEADMEELVNKIKKEVKT